MRSCFASPLSCAALLASTAAFAQPVSTPDSNAATSRAQPATPVRGVTVHALPTARSIQKQALNFVQTYAGTSNPNIDQIGRWRDPVCVMILGLPVVAQAAKIKARIENIAQTMGLPPTRADCKPNVEIAFEDDPQSAMDGVAKRVEPLLGYYHLSRTKQLKAVTHAIQAWYVTATTSDGVNIAGLIDSGVSPSLFLTPNDVDDPENGTPAGCFSRFTACYTSGFKNVLIVADNKALVGDKLSAVADDMALLALSQPRSLDGCNVLPSVIDRFAKAPCPGRDPPEGLTPADTAYLTALYSADVRARKRFEQYDIASRMATILQGQR
jgi:hypothetical protein